ncbi:nucleotidyl transferase AbiEii/AbiGii toxin family protein [Verrucomicrobium sp. 3C]|uniref:nucleotidyl transferase AbiEii/AbiGii toxin family protein n=1 Tax=Verrucomicrobium sp. 3C TaxID=1134055 RepID=UPI00037573BE|nr:nucleotidyl transferase AbiEii/AbiGii toxin family protein [Verrucomicrobium sp. 3C]
MRPLRTRLEEARKRLGLPWDVLERDYLLSWMLAGIGTVEWLRETLVFKGGTALKKCYFGDYRFSEDLDFSGLEGVPTGEAMERAVREACVAASTLLNEYAPVEIVCERYTEKDPHPGGRVAFTIRARFPWQRQPQNRVMIETAVDEKPRIGSALALSSAAGKGDWRMNGNEVMIRQIKGRAERRPVPRPPHNGRKPMLEEQVPADHNKSVVAAFGCPSLRFGQSSAGMSRNRSWRDRSAA